MPRYPWTCFACEHANAPNTESCARCGLGSSASVSQINKARELLAVGADTATPRSLQTSEPVPVQRTPSALVALIVAGFGVLCLYGAYQSITLGKWPAYMPPQLDLLAVPLGWLSERLGAYVGGALAGAIGLLCVVGGLFSAKERNAA